LAESNASRVATSTDAIGRISVEIGFLATRTTTGSPSVIPPLDFHCALAV
jgi:hypothetical protein